MYYHMIAFLAGFLLDLLIGDPHWLYHPVRLIGNLIAALDHRLLDVTGIRNEKKERRAGILLVTVVLLATGAVSGLLLWGAYAIAPVAGCILESIMTYQILATKCLKVESMKVYERLRADDPCGRKKCSGNDCRTRYAKSGCGRGRESGCGDSSRKYVGRCDCSDDLFGDRRSGVRVFI